MTTLGILGLIYLVQQAWSECSPNALDGGTFGLKLTGNGTSNGNLNSGAAYAVVTIKCLSTGYTFNNGVRRVPGLNVSHIDTQQSIESQCGADDKWSPNIWFEHSATGVTSTTQRYMYCTPGCNMLASSTYDITYPEGLVTTEQYSAPITPNSELYVKLACPDGYSTAVGDTGYSLMQCKQKVTTGGSGIDVEWSIDENNRLTCVRGCKDITTSVQYGETTASPSVIADGPPFHASDIVPFSCKDGFTLIGHRILTCTGENVWNEPVPECVMESGGYAPTVGHNLVALISLLLVVHSLS